MPRASLGCASESPARPQDDTTRASNLREKRAVAKAPVSRPRDTGPALVAARFFVFNSRSEAMHTVNGTTIPGLKFELFRASSLPAGNQQGEPLLPWQPGESHRLPTALALGQQDGVRWFKLDSDGGVFVPVERSLSGRSRISGSAGPACRRAGDVHRARRRPRQCAARITVLRTQAQGHVDLGFAGALFLRDPAVHAVHRAAPC